MFKYKSIISIVFVFLCWYLLHVVVNSPIIPSPLATMAHFINIFPNKLVANLAQSTLRLLSALLLGLVVGVAGGCFCASSLIVDGFVSPIVYILSPIPKIAFLPVFMVLFGLGEFPKIVLIALVVVFPFFIASHAAAKAIPHERCLFANSLCLSPYMRFFYITWPSLLPTVLATLKTNIGIGIAVLFFSESFATQYGIGYFIMHQFAMANYLDMSSALFAVSLLGVVLFLIVDGLSMLFCPYSNLIRIPD